MNQTNTKPEWAQSKREKNDAARAAEGLPRRRRRWPWVLLALVVIGGVAAIVLRPSAPVEPETATEPAPPVMQINPSEITTMEPQVLQETIRVTGSLAPFQQTDVAPQLAGQVISVAARPGDLVEEGDVLVQIDTQNLEIQLRQQRATAEATRAQLVSADRQLERTQELFDNGLTSSATLEQAVSSAEALRANLVALEGQVASAELALNNATVRAPLAGTVSARTVEPGQTVAAGTSLMTVVDLSRVELQGSAPVGASAQIAVGQSVAVQVEGLPARSFEGEVVRINPVALPGTRTMPVYISLDNPDGVLRGGMFATGQIVVNEQRDAVAVPDTALREDAEGTYVLKLEGDSLVRQAVETEREWNRGRVVEIASGLAVGDVVVTAPLSQLRPGDLVAMVEG
jgi:RND family efflux transporter MFP subunit